MLRLSKETLVELTPDALAGVVGGADDTCFVASCITGPINLTQQFTAAIATIVK